MKKPAISSTASSMNREELVKETSQPKMLDRDDAMDLELMDGIGHPRALVPAFGAATLSSPQSSSSGTLWPMRPPVGP